ncbi:intercompartmental signaling factor BofC [Alkalihalobacillus pseudalcaliphilus]|uniref:intercompartmental signaling factor BofC n=1 Tax=Alkalihalobacillus pseudalcaliphilus TaxID=79884 RepID=UPI00064DBF2B|nr:intercompartmental signaling factor BofC [Alkalihalobacillus pseudalcaliphilus]KMK75711.1 hypothetical protein AB990_10550 [Alkalihalobacillus pseudalcaliphilus]
MKIIKFLINKKEYPIILGLLFFIGLSWFLLLDQEDVVEPSDHSTLDVREEKTVGAYAPLTMKVVLERLYLDGNVQKEVIEETIWSMEDFWAQYEGWDLIDQNQDEMVFQTEVDDVSPIVKINGFFGLTDDNYLHIYEGIPEEDQIIHSFFQIDTEKLETKQYQQLKEGVRIQDKAHFQKVIDMLRAMQKEES